jgi:hypothetical protein
VTGPCVMCGHRVFAVSSQSEPKCLMWTATRVNCGNCQLNHALGLRGNVGTGVTAFDAAPRPLRTRFASGSHIAGLDELAI